LEVSVFGTGRQTSNILSNVHVHGFYDSMKVHGAGKPLNYTVFWRLANKVHVSP
jgi:hypothetical protein